MSIKNNVNSICTNRLLDENSCRPIFHISSFRVFSYDFITYSSYPCRSYNDRLFYSSSNTVRPILTSQFRSRSPIYYILVFLLHSYFMKNIALFTILIRFNDKLLVCGLLFWPPLYNTLNRLLK